MRRIGLRIALAALVLGVTGCLKDREAQAEIKRLEEDLEILQADYKADRNRLKELEKENRDLRTELAKAERSGRQLESKLASAERETESWRTRAEQERTREPTQREKLDTAKAKVAEAAPALVTVEGNRESGRGVLVEADGKKWIYLPASLVAANTKIDVTTSGGDRIDQFGAFEVAAEGDLARLEVPEVSVAGLELGSGPSPESGAAVFALNPGGAVIEGRVYQATEGNLECDAKIARAGSGTPVFDSTGGALLGIIGGPPAGERNLWRAADDTYRRQPEMVWLNRQPTWTAVPIAALLEESKALAEADDLTRLIHAFAAVEPRSDGLNLDVNAGGNETARAIFDRNASMSAVRDIFDLAKWLSERKMRVSESDMKKRFGSVYEQVAGAAKRQTAAFEARRFSPYHQAAARQSLEWRKEAETRLADTLARIGQ